MKLIISLLFLVCAALTACNTSTECSGDNCVCSDPGGCEFECSPGGNECHIQTSSPGPLDVQCAENEECHVECRGASSCQVDCGGSTECHVTCPPTGCTVTDCVGPSCVVSCGFGAATRTGTTATCP